MHNRCSKSEPVPVRDLPFHALVPGLSRAIPIRGSCSVRGPCDSTNGGARMRQETSDHSVGRIDVSLRSGGVLECQARGFISRAIQIETYRAIDDALRRTTEPLLLLWDSLAVDGFEPGLPIALTRFFVRRVLRFSRAAVVARSPTIVAVSHAARALIPPFPYAVFADRRHALAFLVDRGPPLGNGG